MTEIQHLFVVKAAFKVGARVDTRRCVALEVHEIAWLISIGTVEKVIEANLKQRRQ